MLRVCLCFSKIIEKRFVLFSKPASYAGFSYKMLHMHAVEKLLLLHMIHIVLCSQAISAALRECGWLVNKMAALGYVYTLKHTLHSPKRCLGLNATGTNFIEIQILP